MSRTSEPLTDRVAKLLKSQNISFKRDASVRGLPVDLLVQKSDGTQVAIETKKWDPVDNNRRRAVQQAQMIEEYTGVDDAIVVLDGIKRGRPSQGVVRADQVIDALGITPQADAKARKPISAPPKKKKPTIFAAMPFSSNYDVVYYYPMQRAADAVGAEITRVDKADFIGDIVAEIKKSIKQSIAVIADLSESKPNVLYEVGYAHALNRPTVHICSTPLKDLPFDIQTWNTIEYKVGQAHKLEPQLVKYLKVALNAK